MNPYQKIIKNGVIVQKGNIDTPIKFNQLFQDINLKGKKILDVGCNLGMMCNLATEQGAITRGIDKNNEYIKQARTLFPNLRFDCLPAEKISGNYDIIIASAMLHYINNLDLLFSLFAKSTEKVVLDIWLNDEEKPMFTLSHRNIFIPSKSAFLHIAKKYFNVIEEKGIAITPDISKRYIFHLSKPIRTKPKAILIYGQSGSGKSTLAASYVGLGYTSYSTDRLFSSWTMHRMRQLYSAKYLSDMSRGVLRKDYIDYFIEIIKPWLQVYQNRDIIIEGYELNFKDFKDLIYSQLDKWDITEINLGDKNWSKIK